MKASTAVEPSLRRLYCFAADAATPGYNKFVLFAVVLLPPRPVAIARGVLCLLRLWSELEMSWFFVKGFLLKKAE